MRQRSPGRRWLYFRLISHCGLCIHCVFCRNTKEIRFYDLRELKIVLSHSVEPHRPGRLCTSSPTTLLYVDHSKLPREVRWLDCAKSPPRLLSAKNFTCTEQDSIYDICCVKHRDKQLLITTHELEGINAYNTSSNKREWCVLAELCETAKNIRPQSITTDGHGHLFVVDKNNACIQMFSTGSVYMGPVLEKERFADLGEIDWCSSNSSAAVVHRRGKYCQIAKIQETQEEMEESSRRPSSKRGPATVEKRQFPNAKEDTDNATALAGPSVKKSRWDVTAIKSNPSQFNCKGLRSFLLQIMRTR